MHRSYKLCLCCAIVKVGGFQRNWRCFEGFQVKRRCEKLPVAMLKLVTVAEARQTQVNNLDEYNCKAYVLFHSSESKPLGLFVCSSFIFN